MDDEVPDYRWKPPGAMTRAERDQAAEFFEGRLLDIKDVAPQCQDPISTNRPPADMVPANPETPV